MHRLCIVVLCALLLLVADPAAAYRLEVDGFYLQGSTAANFTGSSLTTQGLNAAVGANLEIVSNFLVQGSYLFSRADEVRIDNQFQEISEDAFYQVDLNIALAGAKYRVYADEEVAVFLGGGYATLFGEFDDGASAVGSWSASSFYLQIGAYADLSRDFAFFADLAYAPRINNTVFGDLSEGTGTLRRVHTGILFKFNDVLGFQAGVNRHRFSADFAGETIRTAATYYGLGLNLRF